MERIKILDWHIEVDKEKTIEYYKSLPFVSELCECINCRNFEIACDLINNEIKELFYTLGLDIRKSQELFYCMDDDYGSSIYWASCDIIGSIIEGNDCIINTYIPENKKTGTTEAVLMHPVLIPYQEGFKVGFNRRQEIDFYGEKYEAICLQFECVLRRII